MQPKEEPKPEPLAEEKPAPIPDVPQLFEAVRLFFLVTLSFLLVFFTSSLLVSAATFLGFA
jgi:hypothetical protein